MNWQVWLTSLLLTVPVTFRPPVAPPVAQCVGAAPHAYDLCWKGQWWIQATYSGQPGPTNFTSQNVSVDAQDNLHLKIVNRNGQWTGAQVESEQSFGYGTYTWQVLSPVYFDPNIASGLFTYNQNDPAFGHRELDAIEGSKFGNTSDPTNSQFTVQPYTTPGNVHRIVTDSNPSTIKMVWSPTQVTFNYNSTTWIYRGTIPTPSAQVFMNMWTYATPSTSADLVIKNFTYAQ